MLVGLVLADHSDGGVDPHVLRILLCPLVGEGLHKGGGNVIALL